MSRVLLIFAVALLFVGSPRPSDAATYGGEIVGTALDGNDSFWNWFSPGQTWTAYYVYESETIDGSFSGFMPEEDATLILHGALDNGCHPIIQPCWSHLTVENGVVVDFAFIQPHPWWVTGGWWDFDSFGGGSVVISNPRLVSEMNSTLQLAAIAFLVVGGMVLCRSSRQAIEPQ